MLDLRLPYFYNLPVVVLLLMSVYSRWERAFLSSHHLNLDWVRGWVEIDHQSLMYIELILITLPAMSAAAYFTKQFYERNDVYVRETLFILGVVNFLGYLIPAFLR